MAAAGGAQVLNVLDRVNHSMRFWTHGFLGTFTGDDQFFAVARESDHILGAARARDLTPEETANIRASLLLPFAGEPPVNYYPDGLEAVYQEHGQMIINHMRTIYESIVFQFGGLLEGLTMPTLLARAREAMDPGVVSLIDADLMFVIGNAPVLYLGVLAEDLVGWIRVPGRPLVMIAQ